MPKGLKLILDVESFDYAYYPRASRGFKLAIADARDKAVISQDGYYLKPGRWWPFQPSFCLWSAASWITNAFRSQLQCE